ncbi:aldo/keto reductase [Arcobacteraceae bacterium]|nr:aldo/keto reductase [Arcobacteraceae bacterium]
MAVDFSFGTYRTTYKNKYHKEALNYALDSGITNIDTSSNYMNGETEVLIAQVLKNRKREDITIVSKGGYIQSANLQRVVDGWKINDIVEYNQSCFHCIDPKFLKDQIDNSLKRLGTSYIDIYLLHNPEYYLLKNITEHSSQEDIKKHQDIMQNRIKKAFEFLENEVKNGTIKGYGISSNSFAKKDDDIHFLEYRYLLDYAKEFGGKGHSFKAIQFPMNPFEIDGEAAGIWGYKNGLEVQVNRPLNATLPEGMLRLASYDECEKFDELLDKMKQIPNDEMQKLITLLLDAKHNYSWAGQVDDTIDYQTVPFIMEHIKTDEIYHDLIYDFIKCYKKSVKHHLSKLIAIRLNMNDSIDKQAVNFLKEKEYISKILIGMRDKEYVDRILTLYS